MQRLALFLLVFYVSCASRSPDPDIKMRFTNNNRSINITGFDRSLIAEINRDTSTNHWATFLPVYKMPADTDLKDFQKAQPGEYKVKDSLIIFTPDTAFKKGQHYFFRYYLYARGSSIWQSVKDKNRPGTLAYKDLSFSY